MTWRLLLSVTVAAGLGTPVAVQAQQRPELRARGAGVLGLMGYNVTPDGSTNAVQISRPTVTGGANPGLTLGQFGFGFTVSESFPLFLESYVGYARYDPRLLFEGADSTRRSRLRWNNVAATLGIGYDIRLGEYLWLRPTLNGSLGYASSDAALFGEFLAFRTGTDIPALTDRHVNVYGIGGSLTLAYYDYQPARDIDIELRYTQIELQTFGDTLDAARGEATARTIGLWSRYRWPTGAEAFGRPIRWVLEGTGSYYVGDQADALGFNWAVKVGGGIEFDIGRQEIGMMGLYASRVRLIGRYFYGDRGVTGISVGLGISF